MTTDEGPAGTGGGVPEGEGESKLQSPKEVDEKTGYWPPWWRKYANDWRPAKTAKANDGLVSPQIEDPDWITEPGASSRTVLESARQRHGDAERRIDSAEGRAIRLVQTALSLLTLALLAGTFGATQFRTAGLWPGLWIGTLVIAGLSVSCLALSAVQALGVDRVGYVHPPEPGPAARFGSEDEQRRNVTLQEVRAAQMANWTARHKVNEFLQARAWLTRGASFLVLLGLIAGASWIAPGQPPTAESTTTTTTSTVP